MAILVMLLGVHAAWAIGWIPGLDGFAQSHQVVVLEKNLENNAVQYKAGIEDIKKTQEMILTRLIASDVEAARGAQCRALADKNPSGAQGWRVRLDSALYEYRVTAGRDYLLRPCDEY
jgi:hypothetical protein